MSYWSYTSTPTIWLLDVDTNDFTFTLIVTSNLIGGNELFRVQNQQPEKAKTRRETEPITSLLTKETKNSTIFLSSRFRASQFNVNKNPTRFNSMQIFIHCKVTLHVSGVQSRSGHVGREVAVPVLWPVPEVAITVFGTPDDGCCDTRNM